MVLRSQESGITPDISLENRFFEKLTKLALNLKHPETRTSAKEQIYIAIQPLVYSHMGLSLMSGIPREISELFAAMYRDVSVSSGEGTVEDAIIALLEDGCIAEAVAYGAREMSEHMTGQSDAIIH